MSIESFYGDDISRFFFGTIVNNNDAFLSLGRVQIRITGIHSKDIENSDLPWASVVVPTTEPGFGGHGSNTMLENGAQVFGVFLDGTDSQVPLVLGSIPSIMRPSSKSLSVFSGETDQAVQASSQDNTQTVPIGDIEGSTNAEKCFNFFTGKGFTLEQASGIVGNFAAESTASINPTILNPNDKGKKAFGIAQWRATRYTDLINYSNDINQSKELLSTQLSFVMHEFEGKEKRALSKIRESSSVDDAAVTVDKYYERSDGSARGKRIELAREIFKRFT